MLLSVWGLNSVACHICAAERERERERESLCQKSTILCKCIQLSRLVMVQCGIYDSQDGIGSQNN